jgi:hypothetical protein
LIRARICKRLRSPGIDSNESIPPAYVAWRAGTSNRAVVSARQAGNRFLGSLKDLKIRALGINLIVLLHPRDENFLIQSGPSDPVVRIQTIQMKNEQKMSFQEAIYPLKRV